MLGERRIADDAPAFVVAEIGANHNGSLAAALRLVSAAHEAGADAVKFQKRTVDATLTREALDAPYDSPHAFGRTYGEHRHALELSRTSFAVFSVR